MNAWQENKVGVMKALSDPQGNCPKGVFPVSFVDFFMYPENESFLFTLTVAGVQGTITIKTKKKV